MTPTLKHRVLVLLSSEGELTCAEIVNKLIQTHSHFTTRDRKQLNASISGMLKKLTDSGVVVRYQISNGLKLKTGYKYSTI